MTESPKLKQILNKKLYSNEDIQFLTSLSRETLEGLSKSLTRPQIEKIYEILSTPKLPSWIDSTLKIHKSTPKLKNTLPDVSGKKDFRKIVEMIMVSAGDALEPNKDTVRILHSHVKKFIRKISKFKKKTLYSKFKKVWDKYRPGLQGKLVQKEEESLSDMESSDVDMKSIERLQFNDLRTSLMQDKDYLKFAECRKAHFSKFGKESFMKWSNADRNYKFLGWVAREKIFDIVENANRKRSPDHKLSILTHAIEPSELDISD